MYVLGTRTIHIEAISLDLIIKYNISPIVKGVEE